MVKIYLSSTSTDLTDYRRAVYDTLRQMRIDAVAMEDYVATDHPPVAKCLADVAEADIYLGLFAWRYGFIPPDENPEHKSITELEYREAVARGKPRFIFLLDESVPWSPRCMDSSTGEGERGERIKVLRRELALKETVSFFQTPQQLASLVSVAIGNWIAEKEKREQQRKQEEKRQTLGAMMAAEQPFLLEDRLSRFVGREQEIASIQALIRERQSTGGYVIITGLAGQGKSSIIAKMIANQGKESTAYHFFQFDTGRDHQLNLLLDLMSRLILKHDLPEHYLSDKSYEILRGYFLRALNDIASKGEQEVIYIDGLDLLDAGNSALPDLSFLPPRLPPGIVIVLGTRPNQTLDLVKHQTRTQEHYPLPGMSREDFELLLRHHGVNLSRALGDILHERLKQNPLYLDLVAGELREEHNLRPQELIARIASNPDDIFTIAFLRMKQLPDWDCVTRPMLGTLLVAQEALTSSQIAHICQKNGSRVRSGIARLGGLLALAGSGRYRLFHPKLNEYLHPPDHAPENDIQFDAEEVEAWHGRVADWCEQGRSEQLWLDLPDPSPRDDYQEYARKHYITHLFHAGRYERLFAVLDDGGYERGKLRYDRSTRASAADLRLGCQAAARPAATLEAGKELLPHLWRYTLLRASLTTRADAYPIEAFQALLALRREREALDLVELLTQPARKLAVLVLLTDALLRQPGYEAEGVQLYTRTYEIATALEDRATQTEALSGLTTALIHAGYLERALDVARAIADDDRRAAARADLSAAYALRNDWPRAEAVADEIAVGWQQCRALSHLAARLMLAEEATKAEELWQKAEAMIAAIADDDQRAQAGYHLALSFMQAKEWERAEAAVQAIGSTGEKISAWCQLALSFTQEGLATRADAAWEEARLLISATTEAERDSAYTAYAIAQIQAGLQSEAENTAHRRISDPTAKITVFSHLASSFAEDGLWADSQRMINLIVQEYNLTDVEPSVLDDTLIRLALELAHKEQWEQAKATARAIPRKDAQGRALMGIVSEMAHTGLSEMAQANWERASAMCTAQADSVQASVTGLLVSILVEVGQAEQAEKIIPTLPDRQTRESVTEQMVKALARAGQIAEAEKLASATTHLQSKASMQQSIALAQMKAGQSEQALATAHAITQERLRTQTLSELVSVCCRAQQWGLAQQIARQIMSSHAQAKALTQIVVGLVQSGKRAEAESIARSVENPFLKASIMCELAIALAQRQDVGTAEKIARTIRRNPRIQKKARCLISLWSLMGTEIAEPMALDIDKSDERDEALRDVAVVYAGKSRWDKAEEVGAAIDDGPKRDVVWTALATDRAKAQQWMPALAMLDRIQTSGLRRTVLRTWGRLLAGPADQDVREQIVRHLSSSEEKACLLTSIASELAETGQYSEQLHLIQQTWLQVSTKDECQYLFALVRGLLGSSPELCLAFYDAFRWVDLFLNE